MTEKNAQSEAGLASDLNRELDTTSDDCKLCGSNCNERDELIKCEREINRLREELEVTDRILAERERVLSAIPECHVHGSGCVPHAIEWIELAKSMLGV